MIKKYELTDETIEIEGIILRRIRAIRSFGNVKKGDLGGFIEKEDNISHEGDCWVYDKARVFGDAKISGNAQVFDYARVFEYAHISGDARVYEYAQVFGDARVFGDACVFEYAHVYGDARVYENALVYDKAQVSGNAHVSGDARVYENAHVYGNAHVFGDARVYKNAQVSGNARVQKTNDILIVGPIGSRNSFCTFYKTDDGIGTSTGCFSGTIDDLAKKVANVHKGTLYEKQYYLTIEFAKNMIL